MVKFWEESIFNFIGSKFLSTFGHFHKVFTKIKMKANLNRHLEGLESRVKFLVDYAVFIPH